MSEYTRNGYTYENNKRKHIPNYRKNTYVEGNTVRQLEAVPKRREEERIEREKRRRRQLDPGNIAIPGVSVFNIVFMMCVAIILIGVTASFISAQNRSVALKKEVVALQSEIQEQKISNDEKYEEILNGVDLSQIYKKATRKLGMVRARIIRCLNIKTKRATWLSSTLKCLKQRINRILSLPDAQ